MKIRTYAAPAVKGLRVLQNQETKEYIIPRVSISSA